MRYHCVSIPLQRQGIAHSKHSRCVSLLQPNFSGRMSFLPTNQQRQKHGHTENTDNGNVLQQARTRHSTAKVNVRIMFNWVACVNCV